MEEKNLVKLPVIVFNYLKYMKSYNYTLLGALKIVSGEKETKNFMEKYFTNSDNQETFALAWINGCKVEEQKFLVKFKNLGDVYGYLNYEVEGKFFRLSSKDESKYFQTQFTREFLEKNSFGWVIDCEGVELIEVDE